MQHQGISVEGSVTAQAAADLGQIPAKRSERVVGFGEKQRGELAPSWRPFAQDQIGQDCPALLGSELVGLPGGAVEMRVAQQVNGESHRIFGCPWISPFSQLDQISQAAVASTRGGGKSSQYW